MATDLDVQVKHAIDRHWGLEGGYSHVGSGDFVRETGPSEDVDFWYAQVSFTF